MLLAPDAGLERVAVPWLHVLRPHPAIISNYFGILEGARLRFTKRFVRNIFSLIGGLFKALLDPVSPYKIIGQVPKKCDIILISHFISESQINQDGDNYFGSLSKQLNERGLNTVTVLINHTSLNPEYIECRWKGGYDGFLLLRNLWSFRYELRLAARVIGESVYLFRKSKRESISVVRRVLMRASIEAISGGTRATLRLEEQVKNIVEQYKPKAVMLTYEGHAWERIAFAAARRQLPKVQCIGFQHVPLFRLQHALTRRLYGPYDPDVIMTCGQTSFKILRRSAKLKDVRIELLGSNRVFHNCETSKESTIKNTEKVFLVLPEGLESECLFLFDFSLRCAHLMPDYRFIWRTHPIIRFHELIQANQSLSNLPKNVTHSTGPLNDDFRHASYVLYRGSSAAIQAVQAGLHPVYLSRSGEISIDPLHQISGTISKVEKVDDFLRVAQGYNREIKNKRCLSEHANKLLSPMVPDGLEKILLSCNC